MRRERSKQEECGREKGERESEIGGGGLLGEKKDDETLFAE